MRCLQSSLSRLSGSPRLFSAVLLRSVFWVISRTSLTSVVFFSSSSSSDLFKPHSVSRTESIPPLLRGSSTRTSREKLAPFGKTASLYTTCSAERCKMPEHKMLWEQLWLICTREASRGTMILHSLCDWVISFHRFYFYFFSSLGHVESTSSSQGSLSCERLMEKARRLLFLQSAGKASQTPGQLYCSPVSNPAAYDYRLTK